MSRHDKVAIPNFVCCDVGEFGCCAFCRIIGGIVADKIGGVFCITSDTDNGGGIIGNGGDRHGGMGKAVPHIVMYDGVGLMRSMRLLCVPSILYKMLRKRGGTKAHCREL